MTGLRRTFGAERDVLIGLSTLLVAGALVIGTMTGAISALLDREATREVTAVFADAQQVLEGGVVRIDGVESGKVASIERDPAGRRSVVTMDVEEQAGSLYADARAVLRFKTVLGGAFSIDLERGTPGSGPLDEPIPVRRTARQVELDDITPVLRGDARQGLRTMPGELREALKDRRAPAELLKTLSDVSPDVERGVGALRGVELDRDLRRLVRSAAATTSALDRPTAELRGLVSGAAVTLQTVSARGEDLKETVRRSPAASDLAVATLKRLEQTLDGADPLIAELRRSADDLGPTLAMLRPVLGDADRLLTRARPLLAALRPAAASLAGVAQRGLPLVRELEPSLKRTDEVLLPMLAEKDPETTKPTSVMIGGTVAGLGSGAGGQMDAGGHFMRFPATGGSAPLSTSPCQLHLSSPTEKDMVVCQSLTEALNAYLSYDPLGPAPGTADEDGRGGRSR